MSPYSQLSGRSFWKTGVHGNRTVVDEIYQPKFRISSDMKIAAAGSCFAQHVARQLKLANCRVMDVEPAPPGLEGKHAQRFGYGVYSARYGNIYLVRQLLQLLQEARGRFQPQDAVWEKDGRFFDALRPGIEPDGLGSAEEVAAHRAAHLAAIRTLLSEVDVFVFTLGLTEAWVHTESGTTYPTAPGTIAGQFDAAIHSFKNFRFEEILADFIQVRHIVKRRRPDARFVLSVSPVPLTATASGQHVLAATIRSKSVLRAVAGQLYEEFEDVDYFPSYELIASHATRGKYFNDDLRSVADYGVRTAMDMFLKAQGLQPPEADTRSKPVTDPLSRRALRRRADTFEDDVICEEMKLEAFA